MKTKKIIQYTTLTYLLSYLCWGGVIAGNILSFNLLKFGSPLGMVLYIIGGNAPPIIATYIFLKQDKIKWKVYVKDIFNVKQKPTHYLLAVLLASVYFLVPSILGKTKVIQNPMLLFLMIFPITVLGGGLEEIGWRKLLQPELRKSIQFIPATCITAVVWSFWHLPLFFMEGTGQYGTNFGVFAITVIGLSFATAIVYEVSNSIWLCILFHGIINSGLSVFSVQNSYITAIVMSLTLVGISCVVHTLGVKKLVKNTNVSL